MKTCIKGILFFMVVLTIFSCSKSNPINEIIDDDSPIGEDFFVKATIDGINLINDEDDATAFVVLTDNEGVTVAGFTGEFSDTQNAIMSIKGFDGVGSYNMADFEGSAMLYILSNPSTGVNELWQASSLMGSGVINVTHYGGGSASGTFSFIGISPMDQTEVEITNGEFHLLLVN